ncbi:caspase family protein [Streptomyces sp. NPDC096205]|uniref:caspase family protein n=1 Tax=Streptomyces sp. NPDC096205 TaxID=3366081 RepID=UPI003821281F
MARPGRRYLIAVGSSVYDEPLIADLPGVPADVRRVCELLAPMGYERVLDSLSTDPSAHELAQGIERWASGADLGEQDLVVVYVAGHGVRGLDRHYLLCADSEPGVWSTALASEDLARPLVNSPLGHLLVVLDTCYAGAGTGEIAVLAAELAATQRGTAGRSLLAAARGREAAVENVFVDALAEALTRPRTGARQEFLGVREVTEWVNGYLRARGARQHARHTVVDSDGQDPFFLNPAHIPGLPADDLDVATLSRLRRSQHGHFDPRSRGVEHAGEKGDHFTGRRRALSELLRFTSAGPHDRKARVVTGDPGSGKSATLGRVWALADPDRAGGPELPVVPLHARRATLEALVAEVAGALALPDARLDDVLEALGERTRPVVVLVDALDEAGTAGEASEGARIARELLQPLSSLPCVRLIVGTRRHLVPGLGRAVEVIDLDRPEYIGPDDIRTYARSLLLDAGDPDSLSPYRGREELAATVADGIVARAGSSFLVARMTARALVRGQITVDPGVPGWQEALPSDAGQAFAAYLSRFGPHQARVERLLRPLAYAQGAGLPWSSVWAPLAEALSGVPCPEDELHWLHQHAGAYIVESPTPAGSVFRLFHETLAEHLRTPGRDAESHRAIGEALRALVPADPLSGARDWLAAHAYVREHLATHAAAGGMIDALLSDADFLVHAVPAALLRALESVTTDAGHQAARIYRASAAVHAQAGPRARRQILAVDAARHGDARLAGRLATEGAWRVAWASGSLVHAAHRATFRGHEELVQQVSCIDVDGRPTAVSVDDDGTVVTWDLLEEREISRIDLDLGWLASVHCLDVDGLPHAAVGAADGTVLILSLDDLAVRAVLAGHTRYVTQIAHFDHAGERHLVTASYDGTVRTWSLRAHEQTGVLDGRDGRDAELSAVVCLLHDEVPHALTGSSDGHLRLWNLADRTLTAALDTGEAVRSAHCFQLDGRLYALAGNEWGEVTMWDVRAEEFVAQLLRPHTEATTPIASSVLSGVPHALLGCDDGTTRVWNLATRTEVAVISGHTYAVHSVAGVDLKGRPHAVTCSGDRTVRLWDLAAALTAERPVGHRDWVDEVALIEWEDGRRLAVSGSRDYTVRLWDAATGTEAGHVPVGTGWPRWLDLIEVHGRTYMGIGHTDGAHLWDLENQAAEFHAWKGTIGEAAFVSVRGAPYALLAPRGDAPDLWDVHQRQLLWTLTESEHWSSVAVCHDIDGRTLLLVGSRLGHVDVWDFDKAERVACLEGHGDQVAALATAPVHGRPHLLTASWDGTIGVWDLLDLSRRTVLRAHTDRVSTISRFDVDGRPYAVTGGWDRMVLTWDLETLQVVDRLHLPLEVESSALKDGLLLLGARSELIALHLATYKERFGGEPEA